MRAAVVRQPGATPVLEQFTDPQPGPGVAVGTLVAATLMDPGPRSPDSRDALSPARS
jgi:hypothetical protein